MGRSAGAKKLGSKIYDNSERRKTDFATKVCNWCNIGSIFNLNKNFSGAARARRAWRYAGCRFGVGQQGGTCGHARRAAHSRCLDRLATGPHRPTRVRATPPRCGLVALPQEALVTADCAFHVSQDFRYVFRCRMSALLTSQTKMPSGRRVTRARHPTSERMIHDAKLITYTVTAHRERLQGPSDSEALPKLVSDWTAQFTSCPRRARLHAMTAQGCDGM